MMTENEKVEEQKRRRKQKLRKGEITLNVLEVLSHGAMASCAILLAFAPGTTREMARGLRHSHRNIHKFFDDAKEQQRIYSLLSYLREAGLVSKKRQGRKIIWEITTRGREKKLDLDRQLSKTTTAPLALPTTYAIEKSDKLIIIIFDILEKERQKRDWFRCVLKNLGFSMVQKSVWLGWIKVPNELMSDLKELNLLNHVKIFSVVEIGNLD